MSNNPEQILEKISPYTTGPFKVFGTTTYTLGLFNKVKTYQFLFRCPDLGISWGLDGRIKEFDTTCSVFELFRKCGLDADDLAEKMRSCSNLPSDKVDQELRIKRLAATPEEMNIFFVNETWRRDYNFCSDTTELEVSVYFKEESRFIIQWDPAKLILKLALPNSSTTREYTLVDVPGKKGVYNFSSIGFQLRQRLGEISEYFAQFGFGFPESLIEDITEHSVSGKPTKTVLRKGRDCDEIVYDEDFVSPDDYDDILDFEEEHVYPAYTLKYRVIPALAATLNVVAQNDKQEAKKTISSADTIAMLRGESRNEGQESDAVIRQFILRSFNASWKQSQNLSRVPSSILAFINQHSTAKQRTFRTVLVRALSIVPQIDANTYSFIKSLNERTEQPLDDGQLASIVQEAGFGDFGWKQNERERQQQASDVARLDKYYAILKIKPGASLDEIRTAYRNLAKIFHPDRLSGKDLGPDFIALATEKFQQIEEAYHELVDALS